VAGYPEKSQAKWHKKEVPSSGQGSSNKKSESSGSSDKGILDKAGETLGKAGDALGKAGGKVVNVASDMAGGAINAVGGAVNATGDAVGSTLNAAGDVVGDIGNRLGFDVGATFTKGGAFQGKVHEKEEIIPQATAQRGAGPISRALGELQVAGSGGSGKRRAATNIFEGATYNINNPVVPDSGAAYHLTDILKRELDPYIEERVKRMIG
jgi:hypothetical protein